MQRKLVRMGQHTLMAAIPSSWVHRHKLKKGNLVEFTEVENKLVLTPTTEIYERKTELTILSPTIEYVWRVIQPVYSSGYDEVTITYTDQKALKIIERCIDGLIGFEIVETSSRYVKAKAISKNLDEEFSTILRRSFFILKQMVDLLQEGFIQKEKKLFEGIRPLELTLNKYTLFLKRIINRSGYKYPHYMYTLIFFLELTANHIEYIRRYYEFHHSATIEPESLQETKRLVELTSRTIELYYEFSLEKFRWIAQAQPHFFWFEKIKDPDIRFNFKAMAEYLVQMARQIVAMHT